MEETPWGPLERLRDERPPAGSRGEETKRRQRELFFAAMVVCCDRRGFGATSVADLLEASGLSRGTFYAHFGDKHDCFAATEAELLRMALEPLRRRLRADGDPATRARSALEALTEMIVAQPAAAKVCLIDCYAAGEAGMTPMAAGVETVTALARETIEEAPGGGVPMPKELARAIVSGFFRVVYNRVAARRTDELPELMPSLWDWGTSYLGLPAPLRGVVHRPSRKEVGRMPPFAALSPEQRIIRALAEVAAEKGYPATTVAEVCAEASVSQTTFYRYFADKDDLMLAAIDSASAQVLAAALPSARRAPDWSTAIRVALEEVCNFLACEPDLAHLGINEVYWSGEQAIATRDETSIQALGELLAPALGEVDEVSPVTLEATMGAMVGVLYEALQAGGAEELPRLAPFLTFVVLAPLLGAERAYEAATKKPDASRAKPRG